MWDEVWEKIKAETMVEMPLFTFPERTRKLDFSQFKVRGHYVYTQEDKWLNLKSLEPYFRTQVDEGSTKVRPTFVSIFRCIHNFQKGILHLTVVTIITIVIQ